MGKTIMNKADRLKQNLRDEINLLEKLFFNFNQYFINNAYLSLFNYFDKYINITKHNELLNNFNNTFEIEKQTKILFELFKISKKKEEKIILNKINSKKYYTTKNEIYEKINNNYYFLSDTKKLYLIKSKGEYSLVYCNRLGPEFKDKIYSVSISKENNQIYACLLNEKRVKIFDYDLKLQEIKINSTEIKDNSPGQFNKCIYIGNNHLATADNEFINIWEKKKSGNITSLLNINIGNKTSDLIIANENYFISVQPNNKTIIIFDIKSENINQGKIIKSIDSIDSKDCLLKYKEYIFINCIKGIALFFIKSKEISQYIENFIGLSQYKQLFLDNRDNLCIIYQKEINNESTISILKLNMNYGSLEPFEKTEEININEKITKIISLTKKYLILCENNAYILKEELIK